MRVGEEGWDAKKSEMQGALRIRLARTLDATRDEAPDEYDDTADCHEDVGSATGGCVAGEQHPYDDDPDHDCGIATERNALARFAKHRWEF